MRKLIENYVTAKTQNDRDCAVKAVKALKTESNEFSWMFDIQDSHKRNCK